VGVRGEGDVTNVVDGVGGLDLEGDLLRGY